MPAKKGNPVLLALVIVLAGLAVVTVVPYSATRVNDLGYYSICSFTPWSALSLLLAAGVIWAVRDYLVKRGN